MFRKPVTLADTAEWSIYPATVLDFTFSIILIYTKSVSLDCACRLLSVITPQLLDCFPDSFRWRNVCEYCKQIHLRDLKQSYISCVLQYLNSIRFNCVLRKQVRVEEGLFKKRVVRRRDVGNEYDQRLLWARVKMYTQSHDSVQLPDTEATDSF